MPTSEAKKKWDKENSMVFSIKLMRKSEADIIEYLESNQSKGIRRGTIFKKALREYMVNHPETVNASAKNDAESL